MNPLFMRTKKEWFPDAIFCIDRFHVVKIVSGAFNDKRKRVQKDEGLPVSLRKEIRGAWKFFLMRPEDLEHIAFTYAERLATNGAALTSTLVLTEKEIADLSHLKPRKARTAKVARLLEADPDLKCANELMHLFRDWSDMPWCADKRDSLSRWISLAQRSNIFEMKRSAKTLKRNREGVLNGYKFNKTNATAEGLNNSIKVMKRMNYGFKTFKRMRRRCLLSLGYMRVIKRGMKLKRREVRGSKTLGSRHQHPGGEASERHRAAAQREVGAYGLDMPLRH